MVWLRWIFRGLSAGFPADIPEDAPQKGLFRGFFAMSADFPQLVRWIKSNEVSRKSNPRF